MERIFEHGEEVKIEPCGSSVCGVSLYRITLDYAQATVPHNVRISWFERLEDGFSVRTPGGGFDKGFRPSWRPVGTDSRSASGAPLIAVVSSRGKNSACAALVASRFLLMTEGADDMRANPIGTYRMVKEAKPAFEFLGVPDNIHAKWRPGGHSHSIPDRDALLDAIDHVFQGKPLPEVFDEYPKEFDKL